MRFGVAVAQFDTATGPTGIGPAVADIARRADDAGFASFWVIDHLFQAPALGPVDRPVLESYSTLAYAAAGTKRIKLGTLVTGVTLRHPGVLMKTVTTLDVLSGGRATLGLGIASFEREHLGLGVPFPPLAERFERLDETVQIAKQMWSDEVGPFHGKHYQLAETLNSPPPVTRPHPPILIGGEGERKTLPLVARYADACNLGPVTPATSLDRLPYKLDVLRAHCAAEGRSYDAIGKTATLAPVVLGGDLGMSPSRAVNLIRRLSELGIDHCIFGAAIAFPEMIDLIATRVAPEADRPSAPLA